MACPRCGGTDQVMVSPGVAQCTTPISSPTGAHPSGAMGSPQQLAPCGYRYQIPNPAGSIAHCQCGMQSVARCTVCECDLCLDHTHRVDQRVMCAEHATAIQEAASAAAWTRIARQEERLASLLAQVSVPVVARTADIRFEHRLAGSHGESRSGWFQGLSREQLTSLRVGHDCPSHGAGCEVVELHKSGKVFRKTTMVTMRMPAWTVEPFAIGINGGGRIVGNVKPGTPFSPNMFVHRGASAEELEIHSRVPRVPVEEFLSKLADRVELGLRG